MRPLLRIRLIAVVALATLAFQPASALAENAPAGWPNGHDHAKPLLSWQNGVGAQSLTGPQPEFAVYYDAYRFKNVGIGSAFAAEPSPLANIGALASNLASGLGVLKGLSDKAQQVLSLTISAPLTGKADRAQEKSAEEQLREAIRAVPGGLVGDASSQCQARASSDEHILRYEAYICAIDVAQKQSDDWADLFICSTAAATAKQVEAERRIIDFDHRLRTLPIPADASNQTVWLAIDKTLTNFQTDNRTPIGTLDVNAPKAVCKLNDSPATVYTNDLTVPSISQVQALRMAIGRVRELLGEEPLLPKGASLPDATVTALDKQLEGIAVAPMLAAGTSRLALDKAIESAEPFVQSIRRTALTPNDFVAYTSAGNCSAAGTITLAITATDLFAPPAYLTPQDLPSSNIASVACHGKTYIAVGGGYSNLQVNRYQVVQKDAAGSSTYTLTGTSAKRTFATALVHTCLCAYPNDKANGYYSLGVGVNNNGPMLLGGFSLGLARSTFLTLGGTYGLVNTLSPYGNQPGDLVNSAAYPPSYTKKLGAGFLFGFSFSLPGLTSGSAASANTEKK